MSRFLALSLACAMSLAWGGSNTMKGRPGFFEPSPDGNSSISRVVPPPVVVAVAQPALDPVEEAALARASREQTARADAELARAERENREAADRVPRVTPVAPGSYFSGNAFSPNVFDR